MSSFAFFFSASFSFYVWRVYIESQALQTVCCTQCENKWSLVNVSYSFVFFPLTFNRDVMMLYGSFSEFFFYTSKNVTDKQREHNANVEEEERKRRKKNHFNLCFIRFLLLSCPVFSISNFGLVCMYSMPPIHQSITESE